MGGGGGGGDCILLGGIHPPNPLWVKNSKKQKAVFYNFSTLGKPTDSTALTDLTTVTGLPY